MIGAMRRDRYKRPELQGAYEQGDQQMHDHNAAMFSDAIEMMVEDVAPAGVRSEAMAAAYEGAADAFRARAAAFGSQRRSSGCCGRRPVTVRASPLMARSRRAAAPIGRSTRPLV